MSSRLDPNTVETRRPGVERIRLFTCESNIDGRTVTTLTGSTTSFGPDRLGTRGVRDTEEGRLSAESSVDTRRVPPGALRPSLTRLRSPVPRGPPAGVIAAPEVLIPGTDVTERPVTQVTLRDLRFRTPGGW